MIKSVLLVFLLSQVLVASSPIFYVDLLTLECKLIDVVFGLLGAITVNTKKVITGYNDSQVSFLLWTRDNKSGDEYNLQYNNLTSLQNSKFDGGKKTYFIIHGFTDNGRKEWLLDIKAKILSIEDANVICLDMKEPLSLISYTYSVCNVYKIAKYNSYFIKWLSENTPLSPSRVHLIGHSLGAHIAGLTGYYVEEIQAVEKVGRITGLDPAGPIFIALPDDKRLHKSQANLVDVIHTNGCELGCLGLRQAIGHIDFYPNGGEYQAGCFLLNASTCSHLRAYELFAESIEPAPPENLTFKSWPCSSWFRYRRGECTNCNRQCLQMGFHLNSGSENLTHYLSTESKFPYAKGDTQ